VTAFARPFLVEFSIAPNPTPPMPELELDATTGLLRRLGSPRPFVEELLDGASARGAVTTPMSTVITESGGDNPDPDMLRLDGYWQAVALAMATMCTKTPDQPDPDLVRVELR
jgi:hypothetical protein